MQREFFGDLRSVKGELGRKEEEHTKNQIVIWGAFAVI